MSTMSISTSEHILNGKWDLYYHLPHDKKWDLNSYKAIINNLDTVEKLIIMNETISENVVKNCMLFAMRKGITPVWEDPQNRNGGCFSFKVVNKYVPSVWRALLYSLCGESLCSNPKYNSIINGITISPKKNFCIIKIWLCNCSVQDVNIIIPILNLSKQGCLFRKHEDEKDFIK